MTATPRPRRPSDMGADTGSDSSYDLVQGPFGHGMPADPTGDPTGDPTSGRLRLRGPADVVAAVPYLLGHEPSRSLVAIAVRSGGDLGVVCRADLPDAGEGRAAAAAGTAARVLDALGADGAESALLALYDGSDPGGPPDVAAHDTAWIASRLLTREGIDVADMVHVGPSRWRSLLCRGDDCCPAEGFDVAEARERPIAVGFVVAGRSPVADRGVLEPCPPPATASQRRAAAQSAARWRRRVRAAAGPGGSGGSRGDDLSVADRFRLLDEWLRLLEDYRRTSNLPGPALIGRLGAAWADDVRVRDACMVTLLPAAGLVPDALLAGSRPDVAAVLADRSCAGVVRGPAPMLRHMAAHLAGAPLAAVLALHAWLAWASGEGAAARDLASRAVLTEPGHRLAVLVLQLLDRAVPPGWAAPADDPVVAMVIPAGAGT